MAAAISLLAFGNAYADCDPFPDGVIFTPETYDVFVKTHCTPDTQELLRQRDMMIEIPKDEPTGMTLEEFLSGPQVSGLEMATERRNRIIEHGPTVGDLWGQPSGTNNFNYVGAYIGDILVVHDGGVPWGYWRHIGVYAANETIIEANPGDGVHVVGVDKFKGYAQQAGLKPLAGYGGVAAGAYFFAAAQVGKPYNYDYYFKWRTDAYYCSSLVWNAYNYGSGGAWDIDTGTDGFVTPTEIYYSPYLTVWQNVW